PCRQVGRLDGLHRAVLLLLRAVLRPAELVPCLQLLGAGLHAGMGDAPLRLERLALLGDLVAARGELIDEGQVLGDVPAALTGLPGEPFVGDRLTELDVGAHRQVCRGMDALGEPVQDGTVQRPPLPGGPDLRGDLHVPVAVRLAAARGHVLAAVALARLVLHLPLLAALADPGHSVLLQGLGTGDRGPLHRALERLRDARVAGRRDRQRLRRGYQRLLVERRAPDGLVALAVDGRALAEGPSRLPGEGIGVLHPRAELLGGEGAHVRTGITDDAVLDRAVRALVVVVVQALRVALEQVGRSGRGGTAERLEPALAHENARSVWVSERALSDAGHLAGV